MVEQVGINFVSTGEDKVKKAYADLSKAEDQLQQKMTVGVNASQKSARSLDQIVAASKKAENEIRRLAQAKQQGKINAGQFQGELNKISSRLRGMGMDKAQSEVFKLGRSYNSATTEVAKQTSELKKLQSALNQTATTKGRVTTATNNLSASKVRVAAAARSATDATNRTRQAFLNTANSIAILDGPLGGIASRFSALGVLIGRTGFALAGFAIASTTAGVLLNKAARAGMDLETTMLSLEGAISLSGGAAGKSAKQIEELVRSIEATTLADRGPLREAAKQMLSFQTLYGETFDRALILSQDFAQVFGKDVSAAALQVAKALENPRQSLASLERAYGALAPGVREHVIELQKQGKLYEAQEIILKGYEDRIGGIARQAAGGLAGAFDTLTASIADFFEELSKVASTGTLFTAAVNALSSAINFLTDNLGRIIATTQAAVIAFGTKLVAAFVLSGKVTAALTVGLGFLRAAFMRLPFVAIVLAAGELIYQFTNLVRAAGGFGEAMSLLKDVGVEVFTRIKDAFGLVPAAVQVGSASMRVFFLTAIEDMMRAFQDLTWSVAEGLNSLFGTNLAGATFSALSGPMGKSPIEKSIQEAELAAAGAKQEMRELADSITAPLKSVEALRDAMKETEDAAGGVGDRPPAPPPLRGDDSGSGGGGSNVIDINEIIAARREQILQERILIGLSGQRRIEEEIYFDLMKQNKDANIKLTESEIRGEAQKLAALQQTNDVLKEQRDIQEQLGKFIESSMEKAFMSIVDGTMSVKDAFKSMASDIIKELYRIFVVKQITGMISNALGFGTGSIASVNANGNAFASGNVIPFANGGVVGGPTTFPMSGGKTGLMGEAGPEAIMPLKRGKDGKLGVTAEGGGNVTVNNYFTVQANGDESVKRIVQQQIPRIAEATKAAVVDSKRRGGSYGRAFG